MNGLITVSSSRSSPRIRLTTSQILTSVAAGACLFTGFLAGANISPQIVKKLVGMNPLHEETISYSKISWMPQINDLKTAENGEKLNSIEVNFVPFAMPAQPANKEVAQKKTPKKNAAMLRDLQLAYQRFEKAVKSEPKANLFFDFQVAAKTLRQDFIASVDQVATGSNLIVATQNTRETEAVVYTQSSAAIVAVPEASKNDVKVLAQALATAVPAGKIAVKPVDRQMEGWKPAPRRPKRELNALLVAEPKKVEGQKVEAPEAKELPQAEVTDVTYPAASSYAAQPEPEVTIQNMNIQNAVRAPTVTVKQIERVPANEETEDSDLNKTQKKKLSETLLSVQLENKKIAAIQAITPYVNAVKTNVAARNTVSEKPVDETDIDKENNFLSERAQDEGTHGFAAKKSNGCNILNTHEFVRPNPETADGVDTQVCPENKTWISKGWNERGWVKVEGSENISTMTMHPAPNGGSTLLLDANALALLAVKSGVRIAKGSGVIIGLVPTGYKIEFVGRGEETQYFELNQKKYFAVINAEPGAGVIELVSEQNQNQSSRVFTPVLEDTVTYLDLAAPQVRNIGVQVVKNGVANDPEVVGLTVGISTQGNIQAITQSNGSAILRNVNVVQGYPMYIDVSSKSDSQASYTYRYELKSRNQRGYHQVNQISERSLYKWLKQVKRGLSDQSAMVVGFYNRKILDGFKNLYTTKTEPKSAHFGLEPMNYSILWNGQISATEPLEGDLPRFMSVQVPEGLSQIQLLNEAHQIANAQLIPVSPRVIHVISE